MKKIRLILCVLAMLFCVQIPALSETVQADTTVKTGLVEKNGKYYYYNSKGKKITNKWKVIKIDGKKYKYYFGKNGAAYAGKEVYGQKVYTVKKIGKKQYGFDTDGKMLKGVYLSYDSKNFGYKFYAFDSKTGVLSTKKSVKLRKASEQGDKWSVLKKLLGKPQKSEELEGGCYGDGTEYLYTYKNFAVNTFKLADGSAEIVLGVSPITE